MDAQVSVGKFEEKESICIAQNISLKTFITFKGRNGNFTVEKLSRHHFNQVITVNYQQ